MTMPEIEKAIEEETKPLNFKQRIKRFFKHGKREIYLKYYLDNGIPCEMADGTTAREKRTIVTNDGRIFYITIRENVRYVYL